MPFEAVYKCDECGRQRQEANHWFVVVLRKRPGSPAAFELRAMQPVEAPGRAATGQMPGGKQFLCGVECVLKALNKFIATLSPKPAASPESRVPNPEEVTKQ